MFDPFGICRWNILSLEYTKGGTIQMKKKLLALLLAGAMALSLAACGGDGGNGGNGGGDQTPQTSAPTNAPDNQEPAGDGLTAETIKIGFVNIGDESDMGYTYNIVQGAKGMMANLGVPEANVITKANCPEDSTCETYLRELAEEGCNIIFATSFGFEDYVIRVASDYPDIQFCHLTGVQAKSSGLSNVHNAFANIYEARYLAGIAAGLKTQTNKLGYVSAFNYAEPVSGYTAFYLGAKSVNPDVTMEVKYANDWNDPTVEARLAQALIDSGCDVISQHSDSTAPATTAESNGVWSVGYNSDQISAAPNASLISSRIDWSVYLTYAVQCMLDGTPIDVDWTAGLAEGAVQLTPLNDAIAAEGTQEAIDAAMAKLTSGELHVFEGPLNGYNAFDESKTVSELVPAGEFYDESSLELGSAPSWDNIIEGITES